MNRARVIRAAERAQRRVTSPELARVVSARRLHALAEVEQARQRAATLIGEAERAAQALQDGLEARAEERLCERLIALERQLQAERVAWMERYRAKLARLAVLVAEQIVRRELDIAPGLVAELVEDVLRELEPSRTLLVRAHPDDVRQLEQRSEALVRAARTADLRIEADASVERGGCIFETPALQVDGRVRTRLEALEAALARELDRAESGEGPTCL